MPKITRIVIKDYRSIRRLEVDIPKKGVIAKGRNAAGKTSFLKAISSALAAQEIGGDSIRHGEDKAEILVDIDALKVRRTITPNSSQLTVTTKEGDRWTKPHGRLIELLGNAGIDPLSFFLAEPKERRRQVLDAMPITVTREQLVEWTGDEKLVANLGFDGHGIEVVEKYRQHFYDVRTNANREAKEARAAVDRLADAPVLSGRDLTAKPAAQAAETLAAARKRADELRGRQGGAAAAREASEATRTKIEQLRQQANDAEAETMPAPTEAEFAGARARHEMAAKAVDAARRALEAAEADANAAAGVIAQLDARANAFLTAMGQVNATRNQADQLQASIASVDAMAPTQVEMEVAAADVEHAERENARAAANEAAQVAEQQLVEVRKDARAKEARAEALDDVVKRLTTEAPQKLAACTDLIPGIAFDGDKISLDGTPIDGLSGAEQMKFAVELARRLNAKAKILVVDGLERLDAGRLAAFVDMATADDFQLFATRVHDGDMVIEAIEP